MAPGISTHRFRVVTNLSDPDGFLEPEAPYHFDYEDPRNWWFREVEESEELACLTWELGREDPTFDRLQRESHKIDTKIPMVERQRLWPLIAGLDGFPKKPWLALSQKRRDFLVGQLRMPWVFSYPSWADAEAAMPKAVPGLHGRVRHHNKASDAIVIVIPRESIGHASLSELMDAVRMEISRRTEKGSSRKDGRKKRSIDLRQALNCLSCVRLRHVFGLKEGRLRLREKMDAFPGPAISLTEDYWRRCAAELRLKAGQIFPYRDRNEPLRSERQHIARSKG